MAVVNDVKNSALKILKENNIESAESDCCEILKKVLSLDRIGLITHQNDPISDKSYNDIMSMLNRRINGEPIQYIIGSWSFLGREYFVGEGVLIPRDDTEVVLEKAFDFMNANKCKNALDLCSGSGIIAVSVKLKYKDCSVFAVEKSKQAFKYLIKNAKKNDAEIHSVCADLKDCAEEFDNDFFDIIISNPPYIKTEDIKKLQKEISFEPKLALDGGNDGMYFYRNIIDLYTKKLKSGGMLAFEIGEDQADSLSKLLMLNGYRNIEIFKDIQGLDRAVTAIKN